LNYERHIKTRTLLTNVYYLKNNPAKFHPYRFLKWRSLRVFWRGHPDKKKNNNNNMKSTPATIWVVIWDQLMIQKIQMIKQYSYYYVLPSW